MEFKCRLKGAFARGGVYAHRGCSALLSDVGSGADVDDERRCWGMSAAEVIAPRPVMLQIEQETVLAARRETFAAIMAAPWNSWQSVSTLQDVFVGSGLLLRTLEREEFRGNMH